VCSVVGWDYSWIVNWKGCKRKWLRHNFIYYSGICLKGLMKTTKYLSEEDTRSPDRDLSPIFSTYKGVLPTRTWPYRTTDIAVHLSHYRHCSASNTLQTLHCIASITVHLLHCRYYSASNTLQTLQCIYRTTDIAVNLSHYRHCSISNILQTLQCI
jgi:hypothetical protein